MWDQAAGVEFGEDAGQAEPIPKPCEVIGDHFRRADDRPAPPRLVPRDRLEPLGALDPPRGIEYAGAIRRLFEPCTQVAVEMHQAIFGVGECLVDGVADIDRGAQIDLTFTGVTGRFPGVTIDLQIWQDFIDRAAPCANKYRIALPPGRNERVLAVCRDADRRVRLAVGLWHDADVFVIVVFAGERKGFLGPCPLDDFEYLAEAFGALAIGDAVGLIGPREAAAPDPEDQPATTDVIDRRGLFSQPQRLAQRQNLDAETDLDVLGSGRDGAGDRQRRGADRALGCHMDLGQPNGIEPPALGGVDLLEGGRERFGLALSGAPLELVKYSEFECHLCLLL